MRLKVHWFAIRSDHGPVNRANESPVSWASDFRSLTALRTWSNSAAPRYRVAISEGRPDSPQNFIIPYDLRGKTRTRHKHPPRRAIVQLFAPRKTTRRLCLSSWPQNCYTGQQQYRGWWRGKTVSGKQWQMCEVFGGWWGILRAKIIPSRFQTALHPWEFIPGDDYPVKEIGSF